MVELQVHLTERLLHVQNVLGGRLQQAARCRQRVPMAQIPPGGWKPARSNPAKCRYCFSRALRCSAARHHQPIRNLRSISSLNSSSFRSYLNEARSAASRQCAARADSAFPLRPPRPRLAKRLPKRRASLVNPTTRTALPMASGCRSRLRDQDSGF